MSAVRDRLDSRTTKIEGRDGNFSNNFFKEWWAEMQELQVQDPNEFRSWESANPEWAMRYNARGAVNGGGAFGEEAYQNRGQELAYYQSQALGMGEDGKKDGRSVAYNYDQFKDVNNEWGVGDLMKIGTAQTTSESPFSNFLNNPITKIAAVAAAPFTGGYSLAALGGANLANDGLAGERLDWKDGLAVAAPYLQGLATEWLQDAQFAAGGGTGFEAAGEAGNLFGFAPGEWELAKSAGDGMGWWDTITDGVQAVGDVVFGAPGEENPWGDLITETLGAVFNPNGGGGGGPAGSTPPFNPGGGGGGTQQVGVDYPGLIDGGIQAYMDWQRAGNNRDAIQDVNKRSQHQYKDINIPGFGTVGFDSGLGSIQGQNPNIAGINNSALQNTFDTMNNPNINQAVQDSSRIGAQYYPGAAVGALDTQSFNPAVDRYNLQAGNVDAKANTMFDQAQGMDRERNAAFNSGQYQTQTGQDLIENSNFQNLATDRLALLRRQTQPYNTMARNDARENLANSGTLNSKAGASRMGAMDLSQGTRDVQNQLNAQTMADDMRKFNIGSGTNLLGQGANAFGTAGNIASQSNAGMGNAVNALQNNARTGADVNLKGTGMENTRVRNRLKTAQDILGFGPELNKQNANAAGASQDLFGSMSNSLSDFYNTAAAPGGVRNSYGTNLNTGSQDNINMDAIQNIFKQLQNAGVI